MTEQEWLASTDPQAMLAFLLGPRQHAGNHRSGPARPSDRKLRLFACAAFRMSGAGVWSGWNSTAVDAAEKFADGLVSADFLAGVHHECPSQFVGEYLLRPDAIDAAQSILRHLFPGPHADAVGDADSWEIADVLRDIVGNPYRPVVLNHPRWDSPEACLECRGEGRLEATRFDGADAMPCPHCNETGVRWLLPLVVSLATAAYDNRLPDGTLDPQVLAVLSDALEDAGCEDDKRVVETCHCFMYDCGEFDAMDRCPTKTRKVIVEPHPLLAHLRSPGPHCRGCWAVDLMLGKE